MKYQLILLVITGVYNRSVVSPGIGTALGTAGACESRSETWCWCALLQRGQRMSRACVHVLARTHVCVHISVRACVRACKCACVYMHT